MNVKLVHATEGGDDLIAYIARVSSSNQDNPETAPRLIRFLIKHNHWSPFEMVSACVEIVTTRDIGRQILRHRSFSFQEFSQRYAEVGQIETRRELRFKGATNRQSSLDADSTPQHEIAAYYGAEVAGLAAHASKLYDAMTADGIAPECARAVLPEGLTPTRLYMHGTIRSWIHYCRERLQPGVQKEHRLIAVAVYEAIFPQFPSVAEALDDMGYMTND